MDHLKTKVCKICGEEKPINEFNSKGRGYHDSNCKVCDWFRRNNKEIKEGWIIEQYRQIIHYILIDKLLLNQIAIVLNKDLLDLCDVVTNFLKLRGQNKTQLKYNCDYCGTEFLIHPFTLLSHATHCCSKQCSSSYKKGINYHKVIGKNNCIYCDNEFDVYDNVPDQKFCCLDCKAKYYSENPKQEDFICSNCNKEYTRRRQPVRYENNYCCLECELEFKHKESWEYKKCEICGEEFECLKSVTQKFCSIQCQGVWQSLNLSGENANGYNHNFSKEDRTLTCEWCGEQFEVKPSKINTAKYCSDKCRQDYFSNVLSQTPEWKERSRQNAIRNLENGVFNTNTGIQILVNNFLDELNIQYKNEKGFGFCAVDNYLMDFDLIIEVMGSYWHCDQRVYKNINYEMQVNRIRMDKIKHTDLLKNHNINILYLWEYDIENNPQLCKNLILHYINNNGNIENYHSFNYNYNNDKLNINSNIEIPYMDWDINDLKSIIDTSVKEKMSHKQLDKWITYNCEYCGSEKEMLIKHYDKQNHHYCSRECATKGKITRVKVLCNNCGTEIEIIKSKYNKNIRFFCNQGCQHEYQKKLGFKYDKSDLTYNINII